MVHVVYNHVVQTLHYLIKTCPNNHCIYWKLIGKQAAPPPFSQHKQLYKKHGSCCCALGHHQISRCVYTVATVRTVLALLCCFPALTSLFVLQCSIEGVRRQSKMARLTILAGNYVHKWMTVCRYSICTHFIFINIFSICMLFRLVSGDLPPG